MDTRFLAGANTVMLVAITSAILLTLGIQRLGHPRTSPRGLAFLGACVFLNLVAAVFAGGFDLLLYFLAVALGSAGAVLFAEKASLRSAGAVLAGGLGFTSLAGAVVAAASLRDFLVIPVDDFRFDTLSPGTISLVRSGVSLALLFGFAGFGASLAAIGKIQGTSRPLFSPGARPAILVLGAASLLTGIFFVVRPLPGAVDFALGIMSFLFGVLLMNSIRAQTPFLLAILATASGFTILFAALALQHQSLLVVGGVVAAAGLAFAQFLARGIGQSVPDVLFGGLDAKEGATSSSDPFAGRVKTTSAEEVAMVLDGAHRVILVPGFGLAASQGQHMLRDLAHLLRERGAEVDYAIHPVAGCVPGQMNLLLSEADIPYDEMKEAETLAPLLDTTDVALVVGASDVVNTDAATNPRSPLAGFPIVDVGRAKTVVVVKRSLAPGASGIANPLFAAENTLMLLGDGKKMLQEVVKAVKENKH